MVIQQEFNTENNSSDWACILGGSTGLGLASAQKLARHGLNICIIHRTRRSKLEAFKKECTSIENEGVKLKTFNADVLDKGTRQEVIRFFLDTNSIVKVLLHSIARGNLKPIFSDVNKSLLSGEDFTLTAQAMAISLYEWSKVFADSKLFAKNARILSFTSEGSRKPLPNYAAVSAAKAALEAITRSLAYEFAPLHITANCIQAGITNTESLKLIPGSEKLKEDALKRNPQKRLTKPEDVANVVYLLAKEEANWINGTIIPVDGGEHLR